MQNGNMSAILEKYSTRVTALNFQLNLKTRQAMEIQDNQDSNIRGVCHSIMQYMILAVERRVADSQGIATNWTAHSSSLQSQFTRNEGKDNTPVASNVSKSTRGEMPQRQQPKFINMPMSENEAAEKKWRRYLSLGMILMGNYPSLVMLSGKNKF